jgi:hypothetical protein
MLTSIRRGNHSSGFLRLAAVGYSFENTALPKPRNG